MINRFISYSNLEKSVIEINTGIEIKSRNDPQRSIRATVYV